MLMRKIKYKLALSAIAFILIISYSASYLFLYKYGNYPIVKHGTVDDHHQKMETTLFEVNNQIYSLQTIRPDTPGNESGRYYIKIVNINDGSIVYKNECDCGLSDLIYQNEKIKIYTSKFLNNKWGNEIYEIILDNKFNILHSRSIYHEEIGSIYNISVTNRADELYLLYESDDPRYGKFSFKFLKINNDKVSYLGHYPINNYKGAPYLKFINNNFYLLYGEYVTIKNDKKFKTTIAKSNNLADWVISDIPFLTPSVFELPCNSDVTMIQKNDNTVLIYYAEADQINTTKLKYATYNGKLEDLFEYYFSR